MNHSEFAQLVERYRCFDNRALVVALAESYGRRDISLAISTQLMEILNDLSSCSGDVQFKLGFERGLKSALIHSSAICDFENLCIHAVRDVMESRNFHMEQYFCDDFPVPDNWDMLEKSNPQYPPIDIEGETK